MQRYISSVLTALICLGALNGCSSPPQPDPELKYELDALVRDLPKGDREYTGEIPFHRIPVEVGNWVEYLVFDADGSPARLRQEVVGEEGEAFWLQQTDVTYYSKSSLKMLIENVGVGKKVDLEIRRVLHRDRKGRIVEVPEIAQQLEDRFQSLVDSQVTGDVDVTVTVPAGTFKNTVLQQVSLKVEDEEEAVPIQQWFNSEVPIWGVVKAVMLENRRNHWELLGFGRVGAVDVFKKR